MDETNLEELVRRLSDLEVALFLCLVAREHCLIETTSGSIDDLAKELGLVKNINESLAEFGIH